MARTAEEVAASVAGDDPRLDAPAPWPGLAAAAAESGVPLDPDQIDRFDAYRRLLLRWNDRFNLTAVADPIEVERRLFFDGLRMLPAVDGARVAGARRLVDVGSGAGFPGLVLKIARPDLDVVLIEATGKKVDFLDAAIAELGLPNARAIHARAEEAGRADEHRGRYDLATARAVAALPALLEYCLPLLRVGGRGLFPKGIDLGDELAAGEAAARVSGARVVAADPLPGGGTRLVVVEKVRPTPARYPRRAGLPTREPLGSAASAAGNGRWIAPAPRRAAAAPHSALAPPERNR